MLDVRGFVSNGGKSWRAVQKKTNSYVIEIAYNFVWHPTARRSSEPVCLAPPHWAFGTPFDSARLGRSGVVVLSKL
jgi:hypothetical protein